MTRIDSQEDKQSIRTSEDDLTTGTQDSSSFVSEEKINNLQKSLILDIKDHLDFNMTTSLLSLLKGEVPVQNLKTASICNYLGHGAEIKYTQLQGGQEDVIMVFPGKDPDNSSEEEHEDDTDVPWKRCSLEKSLVFTGFEEAATDDVHELTKVITSHNLYIDVIGKQKKCPIIYKTISMKRKFSHSFLYFSNNLSRKYFRLSANQGSPSSNYWT